MAMDAIPACRKASAALRTSSSSSVATTLPSAPHSLRDLEPVLARDERSRFTEEQIVGLSTGAASNLVCISESRGGDESGFRSLSFNESVETHCSAVRKVGDVREWNTGISESAFNALA